MWLQKSTLFKLRKVFQSLTYLRFEIAMYHQIWMAVNDGLKQLPKEALDLFPTQTAFRWIEKLLKIMIQILENHKQTIITVYDIIESSRWNGLGWLVVCHTHTINFIHHKNKPNLLNNVGMI